MLISEIIRKAYVRALTEHFELDEAKVNKDVHDARSAPGQWSPSSEIEIYCEDEIPNASDYHDMRPYAAEFGLDPSTMGYYCHAEQWDKVNELANKYIKEKLPQSPRHWHEPYNNAVVNIYCN
jgi:hypothetical protein